MQRLITILLLPVLFIVMMNCSDSKVAGGTGMGNPPQGKVTLSFEATTSDTELMKQSASTTPLASDSLVVSDSAGTPFVIRKLLLNIRHIYFELPPNESCDDLPDLECVIKIPGPFMADLLKGTTRPVLLRRSIPAGTYRDIELLLDNVDASDTLALEYEEMVGHTMMLQGAFSYQGRSDRIFTIRLEFYEEVDIESQEDLVLNENEELKWKVWFDARQWLTNINITRCLDENPDLLDGQGNLILDNGSECGQMEDDLNESIINSGSFDNIDE
jgi:hypothetical protein